MWSGLYQEYLFPNIFLISNSIRNNNGCVPDIIRDHFKNVLDDVAIIGKIIVSNILIN